MMKYLQIVVIDGMNCSRCASKVRNALEAEPTVSVKIDLARGTVTFDADSKLTLTFLNQLLKNTKYTVTKGYIYISISICGEINTKSPHIFFMVTT